MKPMKIFISLMAIMALIISTAFAAESKIDWSDNYITVTGYGAPPTHSVNAAQARMMARRAAIVDGYRQMAEIVNGVQVDSETTVRDMAVENDLIRTKVSGVIRSAHIVSEQQVNGGYEVTMTVPLFGVTGSVASSVLPQNEVKESFPEPSYGKSTTEIPVTSQPTTGSSAAEPRGKADFSIQKEGIYTGVIIDCRGLGLKPAMSPVIKNANLESIYGYKNLDYDYVVSHGMAGYARDMSKASRAGSKPLIVKAQRMIGLGVNPVLSMKDADKILLENQATHFLDQTNVVFLY
jgi:hypothetical protein